MGIVRTVKSEGAIPACSSSQVTGAETCAPGRARVEIEVTRDAAPPRIFELEVASANSADAEGLRVTAEALDPYPSADAATPADKYRLRLRIEAADA